MSNHAHKVHPTGVKLENALKNRLKQLGIVKQRSIHWLMKDAIERYVENEEAVEQLKQETLARWEEAEQGKIVDNKKVVTWLKTWGTNKETERPE